MRRARVKVVPALRPGHFHEQFNLETPSHHISLHLSLSLFGSTPVPNQIISEIQQSAVHRDRIEDSGVVTLRVFISGWNIRFNKYHHLGLAYFYALTLFRPTIINWTRRSLSREDYYKDWIMESMERKGCIKRSPPTQPTASQEKPRNTSRIEWSRLLTGTAAADAELASSASCDRNDVASGRSEEETTMGPRFDLGLGGRKAWYVPNERTVFPVKKGVGSESHREKRKEVIVVEEGVEDDVLWGITEREIQSAMRRQEVGGKGRRLRTHRSLEEDILRIEDEESRRLTAIAYLS